MLLSRLAENVYWAGRYLERAEDTARLVKVQTELYLDLPRSVSVGWTPLLTVTGADGAFADAVHDGGLPVGAVATPEEMAVVGFLTTSRTNPGSVTSCITAARQNMRSVRALIPRSGWEQVNHLHLWAQETSDRAIPRRTRADWADAVIRKCQTVAGLLDGTMSHDQAYSFLILGRLVERADMTTRVLDVQAAVLLEDLGDGASPYADVTWMAVLKSVSAMQMFRRVARAGVSGSRALNFLLTDDQFPRSVTHCLTHVTRQLARLPRNEAAQDAVAAARDRIGRAQLDVDLRTMDPTDLHEFMDLLQGDVARIHDRVGETWFAPLPVPTPPDAVAAPSSTTVAADGDGRSPSQTQTMSST